MVAICGAFVMNGIILYVFVLSSCATGSKIIRTSAKSLAEKAGAAQYAVHIEEELSSAEIGSDHKKRAIFDDSDYEIYQGVVGRPGIDFPIQASIPQTSFNCAHFGNGYFADLDTKCQVFHICEGGKKISFLCPNGTIFQQTDLICDWWFRVNCASSPDYYAESSEILTRSQNNHFRTATPELDNTSTNNTSSSSGSGAKLNSRPVPAHKPRTAHGFTARSQKPTVQTDQSYSAEHFDASDEYSPKNRPVQQQQLQTHSRNPVASARKAVPVKPFPAPLDLLETQEVAETASFVHGHHAKQNSFLTQPIYVRAFATENETFYNTQNKGSGNIQTNFNIINYLQTPERSNGSAPTVAAASAASAAAALAVQPIYRRGTIIYSKTIAQQSTSSSSSSSSSAASSAAVAAAADLAAVGVLQPSYTTPNQLPRNPKLVAAKSRRPQKSQTSTQYYTPTVPTIVRRASSSSGSTRQQASTTTTTTTTTVAPTVATTTQSPLQFAGRVNFDAVATNNAVADDHHYDAKTTPSDHAIEMMRILNELMLGNRLLRHDGNGNGNGNDHDGQRSRSSTAAQARSLALYFATGDGDNSVATEAEGSTAAAAAKVPLDLDGTNVLDERTNSAVAISNASATHIAHSLLSNATIRKYDKLFGVQAAGDEDAPTASAQLGGGGGDDLVGGSQSATESSTTAGNNHRLDKSIADIDHNGNQAEDALDAQRTPAIRSLAQVFTHALSAYLHDPTTFRQVLSEIRPTEPPETAAPPTVNRRMERVFKNNRNNVNDHHATTSAFLINTDDLEVLDFSDVTVSTLTSDYSFPSTTPSTPTTDYDQTDQTESPSRFPSRPRLHYVASADHVPASRLLTDRLEANARTLRKETKNPLALEINGAFVMSTSFPYFQDDSLETFRKETDATPATSTPATTRQSEQTTFSTVGSTYQTTQLPHLNSDIDIPNLEPLNLDDNDLQRSASASFVTANGGVHSGGGQSINQLQSSDQRSTLAYTIFLDPLTINDELQQQHSSVTPSLHTYLPKSTQSYGGGESSATATEATTLFTETAAAGGDDRRGKAATAPPADAQFMDRMQERANEMFGGLNNTSAEHLMNVMRKANKNKTVRKLILLLIQTCDEDYSTTVEQSRTALLNALIEMDGKFNDSIDVQVISPFKHRRGKSNTHDDGQSQLQDAGESATTTSTVTPDYTVPETTTTTWYENSQSQFDPQTTTTDPYDYYTAETATNAALFANSNDEYSRFASDWSTTERESAEQQTTTTRPTTTTPAPTTTTASSVPLVSLDLNELNPPPTPSSTRSPPTTVGPVSRTNRHQTKRIVKDLDDLLAAGSQSYDPARYRAIAEANGRSDSRALDLLRSLYSLAGKLGK